ncbi:hypothetical protein ACXZ1M_28285 [Duganella sp. PWIR1]
MKTSRLVKLAVMALGMLAAAAVMHGPNAYDHELVPPAPGYAQAAPPVVDMGRIFAAAPR